MGALQRQVGTRRGPVFVFSGHGCQWGGMAVELLDSSAVFSEAIRRCEEALKPHVRWSLVDVLRGVRRARKLERVDVVQPTLFAVSVALADLWRACGVEPEAAIGHSQGEIAAAHLAGALSLEDAAKIVALRSRALVALSGRGGVAAVASGADLLEAELGPLPEGLSLAARNSHRSVALSGDKDAIASLLERCGAADLRAGKVAIDYASHSPQVESLRSELLGALGELAPRSAELPVFSTVTGALLDTAQCDAEYWYTGERQTVLFEQAVGAAVRSGHRTLVEIGPHPVLSAAMQETAEAMAGGEEQTLVLATLRRDQGTPLRFLSALAELQAGGVEVDWDRSARMLGVQSLPAWAARQSGLSAAGAGRSDPHGEARPGPDLAGEEPSAPRASTDSSELVARLVSAGEADRSQVVLDAVLGELGRVLGEPAPALSSGRASFKELGLDSTGVVELCNRLRALTGLRLAVAVVFDHPTPLALAGHLQERLGFAAVDTHSASTRGLRRIAGDPQEPIAIVAMACRFPGGVNSPEELWELLSAGRDAIGEFPTDRGWDLDGLYDLDPDQTGTTYSREGGFLYEAGEFDAGFFGISPREALAMDPQQRLFLETSWEALESAGLRRDALDGSQTGVYAGFNTLDYNASAWTRPEGLEGYNLTGTLGCVIAGRVSYALGLRGPALTVDTACSSSLVALHLACGALREGECSLALAGGANVMVTPGLFVAFSRQRALARDGRCKSFAEGADGTGWGEGVGVLLLERLCDARANGREVLGLVRSSAVNQDGASNGFTAPNGLAQQEVIRDALERAGLGPADVDAVEAHGTGTRLGDPVEAQALLATYGQQRSGERPVRIGSIKSNIGHAQAAAGVAGVMKMVLAMRRGLLPRTLHAEEPSREVDWSAGSAALLTQALPWPQGKTPRRAAVSSYGISGTNAHVILEEAPLEDAHLVPEASPEDAHLVPEARSEDAPAAAMPWLLSARSPQALAGQALRLDRFLAATPGISAHDVAVALASRSAFEHRAVLSGDDIVQLRAGLAALSRGEPGADSTEGVAGQDAGRLAFMFTGQGAQRVGMGEELYRRFPVFAEAFDEVCSYLDEQLGRSLAPIVFGDGTRGPDTEAAGSSGSNQLDDTLFTQAGLFAVEVSLDRLMRSWGVRPDFVIGHSIGEITAAFVAGVFSLSDACRLVAARGRLMSELPCGGAMAAVQATEPEVVAMLEGIEDRVAVAAVNGPTSVVLSGDEEPIVELLSRWQGEGRKTRRLRVSHAFHSPRMDAMLDEFAGVAREMSFEQPSIAVISNLTGQAIGSELCHAEYWVRHVREPVRFADGVRTLRERGVGTFLELGPDGVLSGMVADCLAAEESDSGSRGPAALALPALRSGRSEVSTVHAVLAQMWVRGGEVDWRAPYEGLGARRVALPTYAFQRERYWLEPGPGDAGRPATLGQMPAGHPLLGSAVALADGGGWLFTASLSLAAQPWLADHVVMGAKLLPGSALLELAARAGTLAGSEHIQELTLQVPLILPEHGAVQLQVAVGEADESGSRSLRIHSRREQPAQDASAGPEAWVCHAEGVLGSELADGWLEQEILDTQWPPAGAEPLDVEQLNDRLASTGLDYGPAFQGLGAVWRAGEELFVEAALPDRYADQAERFGLHPALLDAALQAIGASIAGLGEQAGRGGAWLPFSWSDVAFADRGASALRMRVTPTGRESVSLRISDATGRPLASVGSLMLRESTAERLGQGTAASHDSLYSVSWAEQESLSAAGENDRLLVALGSREGALAGSLSGHIAELFPDLASLIASLDADEQAEPPSVVAVDCSELGEASAEAPVPHLHGLLELLQLWLAQDRLAESRLLLLTHHAVSISSEEEMSDPGGAALWGLVRSAQSESPGRLVLLDLDGEASSWEAVIAALAIEEPQLAARGGRLLAPRLVRADADGALGVPPQGSHWRLTQAGAKTFEAMSLVEAPEHARALGPGEVRVGVRAAGLNFRDVLIALGAYPGDGTIGSEAAGVVLEVAEDVSNVAPGDRVMGMFTGAFGPVAVTDCRLLVGMPERWTFVQAASMPLVFLTAYYALVDLAGLKPGEKLLVHAATGGVGMAAVQLARHLGAEVFATASPDKQPLLHSQGFDAAHIASSRDTDFEQHFMEQTRAQGVDVVLNSLAREFIDASLSLLPRGGRFVEMGKTDVRDADAIAAEHEGVLYRAFDLMDAGPSRIGEMLESLVGLFESGALTLSPIRVWDLRRAPEAFKFMSQARHTGKIVLKLPPANLDPAGTVLITGGTGGLGALLARHMVAEHGVRELLLVSRSGESAPGAVELAEELEGLGARVRLAGCDVSEREQLRALIDSIDEQRPLRAVVHAAGLLDDGVIASLSPDRLDAVLAPKLQAAWHLHELTAHMDLDAFVLFSSVAGVFGTPGQGNYAAANAFLDALAVHRRGLGLQALAVAWGPWAQGAGMTSRLEQSDLTRMARAGMLALEPEEGLALLDAARLRGEPVAVAVRLDAGALRAQARAGSAPALLRGLAGAPARPRRTEGGRSLSDQLTGLSEADAERIVLEFVRGETASVLGHSSPGAVDVETAFKELGFDSLVGVELRNRLAARAGLQLPVTLVFDHPSPAAVARHLYGQLRSTLPGAAASTPAPRPKLAARADEPIAIVGMSCRYPGGVASVEGFWEMIAEGRDAIGAFPSDRGWDLERLYDPDPDHSGTTYARQGGFLYDACEFDADFFGIGPREALAMDPQQRLLLEASWEAFEHAGLDPASLQGSDTGVFTGVMYHDYATRLGASVPKDMEAYLGTGSAGSIASGRTAYVFGLEGPAVTIDTACSSSLVALHWACQALRSGECTSALAGGATVLSTPTVFVEFSRQRGLAPDGRCKPFAGCADGTAWGEGVGVLVLERLSDARRNGRRVLALVRSSAINQDGASNGLTAPNGPSQQRVIEQALANAGLSPAQVDAVEGHGTGTTLGDPIEAQALLGTYGQGRERPLWLGSVKSNIGHTQAAAGVAGVIKMVMAMRHGVLPRTLHVDEPSSKVDWDTGAVALLTEERQWVREGEPRRAGVSSFGISGTNAHVILEEAPTAEFEDSVVGEREGSDGEAPELSSVVGGGLGVWVLSGRGGAGLAGQAGRLLEWVGVGGVGVGDVGLSLLGRSVFDDRAVVVGDRDELLGGLRSLAVGEVASGVVRGSVGGGGGVAFMFTGQGAQRLGMGRGLCEEFPVFGEVFEGVCSELDGFLECRLRDVLWADEGSLDVGLLDRTVYAQAGLFALEVALFGLVESFGVRPDFLIGHSIGELAAAHVAGVFSLGDACALVAARGRLMGALPEGGAMVAIAAPEVAVLETLDGLGGSVSVAAVNAPGSVVVSGEEGAVGRVAEVWRDRGVRTKRLRVSHAFHSSLMDGMLEEFGEAVSGLSFGEPGIPIVSNVTGMVAGVGELSSAAYWVDHVRRTVRFADGIRCLVGEGVTRFLELGPDGTLSLDGWRRGA